MVSFSDQGKQSPLIRGRQYRYELESINSAHVSAARASLQISYGAAPSLIPTAPRLVSSYRNGGSTGDLTGNMTIAWNAAASSDFAISTYHLYVDIGADGTFNAPVSVSGLTYELQNLQVSALYAFKVAAVNLVG